MTKIEAALKLAVEHQRITNMMDIEAHRTRQGHWHPGTVPCTRKCPMGDPDTALAFRRVLDQGAGII